MEDSLDGKTTYDYDSLGRLVHTRQENTSIRSGTVCDDSGRMVQWGYSAPGLSTTSQSFTYNAKGRLQKMGLLTGHSILYDYNALAQPIRRTVAEKLQEQYSYLAGAASGSTTGLVSAKNNLIESKAAEQYRYSYDAAGSISQVQELVSGAKTTYTYDVQGQLLTAENSDGRKEQYTYDTYGNLRSFDNGITQHTYTYGDGDWKDLLTALDGHALTYDAIGNPTGYYNGAAYGMAWTEGRRLGSVTVGGKSFTYTYDRSGIRSGKTSSDGSSRKYYLVDGKAVGETVYKANGSFAYNLRYTFDENGSICGVSYWGPGATAWTKYYFTKNLQGDVTAVYRVEAANNQIAGFTKVAAYTYDAWGNVLSQSGDFATINPFRYRSYYYDTETGFYYLQSRYYDPAIGRFVSADSFASTGQSFLGYNMFAYCNNDPINHVDPTGAFLENLWDAFVQTIQEAHGYFAAAASISLADTPAPGPADVVSGILLLGGVMACAGIAVYTAITTPASVISVPRTEEKTETIAIQTEPDDPVIFPVNPNSFNPIGLVKVRRPGTKNGAFISWMDPLTNTEVFRWDENLNYPNGPHYHILGAGHFYPGMTVPEPFATIYFHFG